MLPRKNDVQAGKTIGTRPAYMPMSQRLLLELATEEEWVPEGALVHAAFQEGRYWLNGDEVTLTDLLSLVDEAAISISGMRIHSDNLNRPWATAEVLALLNQPCTVRFDFDDIGSEGNNVGPIMGLANDSDVGNATVFVGVWSQNVPAVEFYSFPAVGLPEGVLGLVDGGRNKVAWTMDRENGADREWALCVNGGTATANAPDPSDWDPPIWEAASIGWGGEILGGDPDKIIRSFTIWAARPSVDLPVLSAL